MDSNLQALDAKIRAGQAIRTGSQQSLDEAKARRKATAEHAQAERTKAVGEFTHAFDAFQALGYTFGPMEQTLRWDFLKPDYARTSAPLKWNDKTEPYRPGRTTRLLEIEVLSSVRPAAGDRPEVPTNAYPYRLAEPEGILISGQIQSFSHVYTAGGSDPGVGDDVFVPMLSFKRFLSQAELEAPARDQLLQDVLVAMLDALADTINAPDFIQTLD